VPYAPNERDFSVFENVFCEPHKFKRGGTLLQKIENQEQLDFLFKTIEESVQEISRPDLKEYFFDCLEKELNLELNRQMTGKFQFPMMKFSDRLEAVKQAALNDSNPEILETEGKESNPNFTTARQVLAVYYLLEHCEVKGVDQTQIARFIEFLTGKNYDNIYKALRSPLASKVGNFRREDLQYIRPFFENLGLVGIVKTINNQLDKPEQ